MPRQFDEREFLLQVRNIPTPSRLKSDERDFYCGAFCNLYTVIGDKTYGVPAALPIHPREEREDWYRAKILIAKQMVAEQPERVSIAQMCSEVETELRTKGIMINGEKYFWL